MAYEFRTENVDRAELLNVANYTATATELKNGKIAYRITFKGDVVATRTSSRRYAWVSVSFYDRLSRYVDYLARAEAERERYRRTMAHGVYPAYAGAEKHQKWIDDLTRCIGTSVAVVDELRAARAEGRNIGWAETGFTFRTKQPSKDVNIPIAYE